MTALIAIKLTIAFHFLIVSELRNQFNVEVYRAKKNVMQIILYKIVVCSGNRKNIIRDRGDVSYYMHIVYLHYVYLLLKWHWS